VLAYIQETALGFCNFVFV